MMRPPFNKWTRPILTLKIVDLFKLKDRFAPVIIQAGDQQQYGSFEAFMSETQNAPIALYKTVVPSFNILTFTPDRGGP